MADWEKFRRIYAAHNSDTAEHLRFHVVEQLRGIDLSGKSVLEVGCGKGFTSLFLALFSQATCVTALDENRGVGSPPGVLSILTRLSAQLGVENRLAIVEGDIMEMTPDDERLGRYDVIIANQTIHHVVDHGARYWKDTLVRERYTEAFRQLREFAVPGGTLSVSEVNPYNLWRWIAPDLVFPNIVWEGHPPVSAWVDAFRRGGWSDVQVCYSVPYKLRVIGALLSNSMVNLCLRGGVYVRGVARMTPDPDNVNRGR